MKDKINELVMNTKNMKVRDMYRGINEFKRGYQPRSNLVKHKDGNLLAEEIPISSQRTSVASCSLCCS
jgi:hypothetical protein